MGSVRCWKLGGAGPNLTLFSKDPGKMSIVLQKSGGGGIPWSEATTSD